MDWLWLMCADVDVTQLYRRIADLDAELASFQRQVATVTAERDAERCASDVLVPHWFPRTLRVTIDDTTWSRPASILEAGLHIADQR